MLVKMSWSFCNISLNSDTSVFYTGDVVTGSLLLEFNSSIPKLTYLYCDVIGKSKAQWTRPMPTVPYIKIYSEKRQVLYIRINIQYNYEETQKHKKHMSNFQFILPEDIPSSFRSSVGKVNYKIVLIGATERNIKKTETLDFTVLQRVDLCQSEGLLAPSVFEIQKDFTIAGNISVYVRAYTSFTCGQNVPVEIDIINEYEKKISKVRIELIRKIEYTVKSGHLKEEKVLCHVENKQIPSQKRNRCYMNIIIPKTVPSSMNATNVMINIAYILRVEVCFLIHFSLYKDVPVNIGSMP